MNDSPHISARPRTVGEGYVWLCGVGLVGALVMVVGLTLFIFWQGLTAFWPADILEIEIAPSAVEQAGAEELPGRVLAGRKTGEQPILDWNDLEGLAQPRSEAVPKEWRVYTGNREVYGSGFFNVPESRIVSVRRPEALMAGERISQGETLFYPMRLEFADGEALPADSTEFNEVFYRTIREARERREQIELLEKVRIGRVNRKLDALRTQQRSILREYGPEGGPRADRLAEINASLTDLVREYEAYAAEAQAIRRQQGLPQLVYRLATGEIQRQPLSDFLYVTRPNGMNFLQKLAAYLEAFWRFLSTPPREANMAGGIFPAIFGTFVMTVLMSAAVLPFGVIAALYLREYARQGPLVRLVRIAVLNLAGVPSIVFGVFGLGFFVYFMGAGIDALFFADKLPTATFGTGGILWASLTLALMTVPVVIVATEEAIAAVPKGMREASLACGATKWQTTLRVVLPASLPGVLTGLILAMARGAGEVAPLMLVGVVKLAPSLPVDLTPPFVHLDRKFMHLGFHVYDLGFQSPNAEAAMPLIFATTILLVLLVLVLNFGAVLLRNHLRRKYSSDSF